MAREVSGVHSTHIYSALTARDTPHTPYRAPLHHYPCTLHYSSPLPLHCAAELDLSQPSANFNQPLGPRLQGRRASKQRGHVQGSPSLHIQQQGITRQRGDSKGSIKAPRTKEIEIEGRGRCAYCVIYERYCVLLCPIYERQVTCSMKVR